MERAQPEGWGGGGGRRPGLLTIDVCAEALTRACAKASQTVRGHRGSLAHAGQEGRWRQADPPRDPEPLLEGRARGPYPVHPVTLEGDAEAPRWWGLLRVADLRKPQELLRQQSRDGRLPAPERPLSSQLPASPSPAPSEQRAGGPALGNPCPVFGGSERGAGCPSGALPPQGPQSPSCSPGARKLFPSQEARQLGRVSGQMLGWGWSPARCGGPGTSLTLPRVPVGSEQLTGLVSVEGAQERGSREPWSRGPGRHHR